MNTMVRALAAASVAVLTLTGCSGGGSGSSVVSSSMTGAYAGHGAYINPIDFTVSNGVVTGVHGMVTLNCTIGDRMGSEQSEFSDAHTIRVGSGAAFSDAYPYKIGNGQWTLHVNGQLYSNGSATGYLSVQGVGCSTSTNGWAAARSGVALPAIPTQPPSSPAAACSPQPCQNQSGVTLSVQGAASVSESDDPSAKGVDVTFSVANGSTGGVTIENTFQNFRLQFGNGDIVDHSWAQFTDANGQAVPCLRGDPVEVGVGQQVTNQHICFLLPHDETGQQMSFIWGYAGPPFVIPLGALQ